MDPSHGLIVELIILIICFLMSGFFSGAETALLSVNKIRMRTLAEDGNGKARMVCRLVEDTDSLLSTILIGNNLVNIGASSLSTVIAIGIFGDAGAGIATALVTIIILIFGEITPKSLAAHHADAISMLIAHPVHFLVVILKPLVIVLNVITKTLVKMLGGKEVATPTVTEEELKTYVTVSQEEGVIEEEEKEMIHNVFEFGDTEIREIMTPRVHVVSIPDDITYDELMTLFKEQRFSRIPVYSAEDNDDIVGVLNIKDLLLADVDKAHFNVRDYCREPFVVYEFNHIADVFERIRSTQKSSLAIVLDEYGIMSGIVTIEDIIEEIVGDIHDEYDIGEEMIQPLSEDTFLVDGSVHLNDLNDLLGTHFESDDFESIGGLVLGQIGEPQPGQELTLGRAKFKIEKIHKNRIETLQLTLSPKDDEEHA